MRTGTQTFFTSPSQAFEKVSSGSLEWRLDIDRKTVRKYLKEEPQATQASPRVGMPLRMPELRHLLVQML